MPANLYATIRYHVIDQCLQHSTSYNDWETLAFQCQLYFNDHNIAATRPSKRTIMGDIKIMRGDLLKYNAPIEFSKDRGYYYSDENYSIHQVPLNKSQLTDLRDALMMVKQLTKNQKLASIAASIESVEFKLLRNQKSRSEEIVFFEESLNESGIQWLDVVYSKIKANKSISIHYAPFDQEDLHFVFSPYLLKEYNNRWYAIGYRHDMNKIINIGLDRIIQVNNTLLPYKPVKDFNHNDFYKNIYGVTFPDEYRIYTIKMKISALLSKYFISKPIHSTQRVLKSSEKYSVFEIKVVNNYEIIHKLLSFGADLEVLSPKKIRMEMVKEVKKMNVMYGFR